MSRRWMFLLPAVLLAALTLAAEARAHGGNFRLGNPQPGGPRTGPPPSILPGQLPTTPGVQVGPGRRGRPQVATVPRYGWRLWWALNRDALMPPRQPARALRPATITPSAYGEGLSREVRAKIRWRRDLDAGARTVAIPFLLKLLAEDRDGRKELTGVALIALARSARDGVAVPYLRRFAFARRTNRGVRECAVIGMGLARRTRTGDQLPLETIELLRRDLMRVFDDAKASTKLRGFALYSLALLADQPYGDGPLERYGRQISRWYQAQLGVTHADPDLSLALLAALAHQPPEGVSSSLHAALEDLALRRYAFRHRWNPLAAAQAIHTLTRLHGPRSVRVAKTLLRGRRPAEIVQCAACMALTLHAANASPELRVELAQVLTALPTRACRVRVKRMALLALGNLLHEDLREGSEIVLTETKAAHVLRMAMTRGSTAHRPYAAVSLGLAARCACPRSRPSLRFAVETRRLLTKALKQASGSDEALSAYAAAIGMARADEARPHLLDILRDPRRGRILRGQAALALAEFGQRDPELARALLDASRERLHPWLHAQAVRALAVLGIPGATEDLLEQFSGKRTQSVLVAIAASLGRLGDPKAAAPMISMARDPSARPSLRIASVVGLGLLFDREERPSRTRLTRHASFMTLPWTMARYIDVR